MVCAATSTTSTMKLNASGPIAASSNRCRGLRVSMFQVASAAHAAASKVRQNSNAAKWLRLAKKPTASVRLVNAKNRSGLAGPCATCSSPRNTLTTPIASTTTLKRRRPSAASSATPANSAIGGSSDSAASQVSRGLTLTGSQAGTTFSKAYAVVTSDRAGNRLQICGDNGSSCSSGSNSNSRHATIAQRTPRATPGRASRHNATMISGTLITCRITSDRKPPRVPPPSTTLAASSTAQQ